MEYKIGDKVRVHDKTHFIESQDGTAVPVKGETSTTATVVGITINEAGTKYTVRFLQNGGWVDEPNEASRLSPL